MDRKPVQIKVQSVVMVVIGIIIKQALLGVKNKTVSQNVNKVRTVPNWEPV
jgi:DNA-binding transcriptional regulator YdaS (Cro superfamily)